MAKFRYQHIKSSVEGKAPTAAQLKVAEIGVNDFAGDEKLFIKNSENEVVDFPRGYSREYIDDIEQVIASSLNDLNTRKLDASAYTPTDLSNYYTKDETSGATEIQDALDEKADLQDIPSVSGYADSVKYNSTSQYVEFYHGGTGGTKVFEYDASPFLIDGMVESVVVTSITSGASEVQVLEITWNSAAGSQVTDIPLSDIFDPNLYYTKSETSGATEIQDALDEKSDTGHTHDDRYYTKEEIDEQQEVVSASLNDLQGRKADKDEFDEQFETISASLNDLEERKADKDEFDDDFEAIAASLNDLEERKANEADLEEIGEATAYALNDLECRKAEKDEFDEDFEAIAASLNDLEHKKLDATAYTPTDLSNYYTKSETSGASEIQDALDEKLDATAYTPTDLSNYYTKDETSGATEIQDALDEKLDASAYTPTDLSNYYTKDETSGATEIQDALDDKADLQDIPSVSGYADSVKYNSTSQYVEFYHGGTGGTKVFEYDASPFLIDGMVESVAVTSVTSGASEVQVLEITWNSAAGSQVTDIPLSDIFDPNLYYTKSETSGATEIQDALDEKLDATAYTPTDLSNYYTKSETSGASEIQDALDDKSDTGHTHDDRYYTKSDVDSTSRVIASSLNDLNTRKLDTSAYTPTDLSNYYTKDETSGATEIQDALDEKLDASAYTPTDLSNYYTKDETSGATEIQDALDNKADLQGIPSVSGYADSVKYNSTSQYVEFYHGGTGGTKVFEYDASPFLIDGMVESVVVTSVTSGASEVQVLEITWNSAAGSQVTDIPLSDIFDPSLYYTKSEIEDNERVVAEALNDLNTRKLDASAYTPTDLSNYYTKSETSGASEIQDALDEKLDATAYTPTDLSNYYTKSETSGATEIQDALDDKSDTGHTHSEYATKVGDLDNVKLKKITQASYDALVQSGATDSNTLYIITD